MKTRILMVCLGNICRSPLAEGILRSKVDSEKVYVDSAGTSGYHIGNLPDSRSIAVAKKHQIDIREQRCRKFEVRDFKKFDRIYAMDKSNYDHLITLASNDEDKNKVSLILKEANLFEKEVPDPYYDDNGFEHVYQLLETACELIAKRLVES